MKTPTDLEILDIIYNQYYRTFKGFVKGRDRQSKVYVPIDVDLIGRKLYVDGDIIFGRLYYYLNKKYSYKPEDGSAMVEFFCLSIGGLGREDKHCIQFPLMGSVLAEMRHEKKKYRISTALAILSLVISIAAVVISIA
jgi:hypothetical protein